MSIKKLNDSFSSSIGNKDISVIALSGSWGSGKSYVWQEYQKRTTNENIRNAIYISLFGIRSITDFKIKLLMAWVEQNENKNNILTYIPDGIKIISKVLKGLHKSAEAIDNMAFLAIPKILNGKFIVLDDIERKHNSLDIDEILGFIDEFTTKQQTRFLLILNSDKLKDNSIWEKFREKVIHTEIFLKLTSDEACDIALFNKNLTYSEEIKRINKILGIVNIRVLKKIIQFIEKLFKNNIHLHDQAAKQLIPSIMLLNATHYKSIPNPPSLDYIVNFNLSESRNNSNIESEETKAWVKLLHSLGIYQSSDFEKQVSIALTTQIFDYEIIDRLINQHQIPAKRNLALRLCDEFIENYRWDPQKEHVDLSKDAVDILDMTEHLDVSSISMVCEIISSIGDKDLEEKFIQKWIESRNISSEEAFSMIKYHCKENTPRKIMEYLKHISEKVEVKIIKLENFLIDESFIVSENDKENIVANSSINDYIELINSINKDQLKKIFQNHYDWLRFGSDKNWHKISIENFTNACKHIVGNNDSRRISFILKINVLNGKYMEIYEENLNS